MRTGTPRPSRVARRVRSVACGTVAVLTTTVLPAAALTACGSSASERPPVTQSTVPVFDAGQAPPAPVLAGRLRIFVERVRAGQDLSDLFEGDRLLIITDDGLAEVSAPTNVAEVGAFAGTNLDLPGDCETTACRMKVAQLLEVLMRDLELGRFVTATIDPASPLAAWPAVAFDADRRGWTVSFGPDGSTIVAIEVAGTFEPQ